MKGKQILIVIGIVIAIILSICLFFASTNNRAISLEEQIKVTDSDVQVQEKRRTDLIYNLVDCVKAYDAHESDTLLVIVEARGANKSIDIDEINTSLAATVEAYPELKSNENYKELMNELAITENKIAESRSTYNSQVRNYNKYVRKFPHKQILAMMGYETVEYEYLEYSDEDTKAVSNLFGE